MKIPYTWPRNWPRILLLKWRIRLKFIKIVFFSNFDQEIVIQIIIVFAIEVVSAIYRLYLQCFFFYLPTIVTTKWCIAYCLLVITLMDKLLKISVLRFIQHKKYYFNIVNAHDLYLLLIDILNEIGYLSLVI